MESIIFIIFHIIVYKPFTNTSSTLKSIVFADDTIILYCNKNIDHKIA